MSLKETIKNSSQKEIFNSITASQKFWLTRPQNLSKHLDLVLKNWRLSLLYFGDMELSVQEQDLLNAINVNGYGRIISHKNDTVSYVLAKVIMPLTTYHAYRNELDSLGEIPIGSGFLFKLINTKRTPFKIEKCCGSDCFLQQWLDNEEFKNLEKEIWLRTSMFELDSKYPMLIKEYFLKQLPIPPKQVEE